MPPTHFRRYVELKCEYVPLLVAGPSVPCLSDSVEDNTKQKVRLRVRVEIKK